MSRLTAAIRRCPDSSAVEGTVRGASGFGPAGTSAAKIVFCSDPAGCCTGNRCLQSASRCRAARDARRAAGHYGWLSTDSS
eukprot:2144165-Heterocapsa_arctica.AAC.1